MNREEHERRDAAAQHSRAQLDALVGDRPAIPEYEHIFDIDRTYPDSEPFVRRIKQTEARVRGVPVEIIGLLADSVSPVGINANTYVLFRFVAGLAVNDPGARPSMKLDLHMLHFSNFARR